MIFRPRTTAQMFTQSAPASTMRADPDAHHWCKSDWNFALFNSGFRFLETGAFENLRKCRDRNAELSTGYNLKAFNGITVNYNNFIYPGVIYISLYILYSNYSNHSFIQSFIDAHSGFSNLAFGNFETIFVGGFVILTFIFVAFCVHHLVAFLQKKQKRNRIHVENGAIVTSMPRTVRLTQHVQRRRNRRFGISVSESSKFSSKFSFRFRILKSNKQTSKVKPLGQPYRTWIRPK